MTLFDLLNMVDDSTNVSVLNRDGELLGRYDGRNSIDSYLNGRLIYKITSHAKGIDVIVFDEVENKIQQWLEEYKEFVQEEYYEDGEIEFDEDGYLGLAHTTIGANDDFSMQVSYNPSSQTLRTEIDSGDLSVTEEKFVEIDSAYQYLDFDSCYHIGNNLVEKFVGEDFEW